MAGGEHGPHVPQSRRAALGPDLVDPLEHAGVGHEQLRAGVLEGVRELAALEREVHGHVHVAGRDAGQEEQRVGVRVGGVGGHPGAGRQAGVLEAAGHAVRSVPELGVGPVAVLEAQGDGLRGAGDRACEHAADRVLRGGGEVAGVGGVGDLAWHGNLRGMGQRRSITVTLAWPPPSHMVCRP